MTCHVGKAVVTVLASEVVEYLERFIAAMPADAMIDLEDVGEHVTLALVTAVSQLTDDPQTEHYMKGHLLFGALHAGLYSAMTGERLTARFQPQRDIKVN